MAAQKVHRIGELREHHRLRVAIATQRNRASPSAAGLGVRRQSRDAPKQRLDGLLVPRATIASVSSADRLVCIHHLVAAFVVRCVVRGRRSATDGSTSSSSRQRLEPSFQRIPESAEAARQATPIHRHYEARRRFVPLPRHDCTSSRCSPRRRHIRARSSGVSSMKSSRTSRFAIGVLILHRPCSIGAASRAYSRDTSRDTGVVHAHESERRPRGHRRSSVRRGIVRVVAQRGEDRASGAHHSVDSNPL